MIPESVSQLLDTHLNQVEDELKRIFTSHKPLVNEDQIQTLSRGKKLRPALLLLSHGLNRGTFGSKAIKTAAAIEILHIASLLHDDILDNADQRRGDEAMHLQLGTNAAILLGDLHFTESVKLISDQIETLEDVEFFRNYIDSAHEICRGQIREIHSVQDRSTQALKDRYFRIIEGKTGELIRFSCSAGCYLSSNKDGMAQMEKLGFHLGRAFQIIDDILDLLGTQGVFQKTMMKDLLEQRFSLPIIYALDELDEQSALHQVFFSGDKQKEVIRSAMDELLASQGIQKSFLDAKTESDKALEVLNCYSSSDPYRIALASLIHTMLDRKV